MYSLAFTLWVLTSPLFGLVQVWSEDVGKDPKMVSRTIYPWRESLKAPFNVWENTIGFQTVTKVQSERFSKGEGLYKMQGPEMFEIDESTGRIWLKESLDRETHQSFELIVFAVSLSGEYLEKPAPITILVQDLNDNKPVFTQQVFTGSVLEFSPPGTVVMQVSADDADKPHSINTDLVYSIIGQESIPVNDLNKTMFEMDKASGIITTKDSVLDREVVKAFQLRIKVSDKGGTGLTNEAMVIINVTDINNHVPGFSPTFYHMTALENTLGDIGRVNVTEGDEPGTGNWEAKYSVYDDPQGYFSIRTDAETNQGILSVVKPLDYESAKEHKLTLQVVNINLIKSKATNFLASVTVTVIDKDEEPCFTEDPIKLEVPQNVLPGTSLKSNIAIHPVNLGMRFEITDDPENWLDINIDTGEIVAKSSFNSSSAHVKNQVYTVTIKLTDTSGTSCTATVLIILVANRDSSNKAGFLAAIIIPVLLVVTLLGSLVAWKLCRGGHCNVKNGQEDEENAINLNALSIPVNAVPALNNASPAPTNDVVSPANAALAPTNAVCATDNTMASATNVVLASENIHPVCNNPEASTREKDPKSLSGSSEPCRPPGDQANIADLIIRYLEVAAKDPNVPAHDVVQIFHYEGEGSVSESLSSICSFSSDDQDQDLNNWGPRFKMLAEIFDPSEEDETISSFFV